MSLLEILACIALSIFIAPVAFVILLLLAVVAMRAVAFLGLLRDEGAHLLAMRRLSRKPYKISDGRVKP